VAEVAKYHMLSESTIYAWRKHFGALDVVDGNPPLLQGSQK
jgi:hypothetical protein